MRYPLHVTIHHSILYKHSGLYVYTQCTSQRGWEALKVLYVSSYLLSVLSVAENFTSRGVREVNQLLHANPVHDNDVM